MSIPTPLLRLGSIILCLLLVAALNSQVCAQRPPDMKLDAATNRQVVEGAIKAVNKYLRFG
ncbi:MAG TPA: hypothetical protein VF074_23950 [Pyrinomonadaceae bacterium]